MRLSVALPTPIDRALQEHLLRRERQEDLCFALWHPSSGANRRTALVSEIVLPLPGERRVHGNASFLPDFVQRVVGLANRNRAGICLLHSHVGPGWQGMSSDNVAAENGLAPASQGATSLPLVGLTLGTDRAWSGPLLGKARASRVRTILVRVGASCRRSDAGYLQFLAGAAAETGTRTYSHRFRLGTFEAG